MSYLRLATVTLIWKQTVAFLLSVKWRESNSITGYRRHLLFRSGNGMHSEPFKIKAWFLSFFQVSLATHWKRVRDPPVGNHCFRQAGPVYWKDFGIHRRVFSVFNRWSCLSFKDSFATGKSVLQEPLPVLPVHSSQSVGQWRTFLQ